MTQPIYTQQALSNSKLERLKKIANELGITPAGNKTPDFSRYLLD